MRWSGLVCSVLCFGGAWLGSGTSGRAEPPRFEVVQQDDRVTVSLDGQLFTEYLVLSGHKPILWPIIGPTGKPMTRAFPMDPKVKGEKKDHPHQRSLWFTHGEVNHVDFWAEFGGKKGKILHREFRQVASQGESATIVTTNDWVDPEGQTVLSDERRLRFSLDGDARVIDFDITLHASAGDVVFGDTKEGSFGIRVPTIMDVNNKRGGRIVNSEGQSDGEAWGKPAAWVDYHGPLDGEVVGIAILNHPSSFRYPTYWHVRDYGLFAANPFGLHDFQGIEEKVGEYKLPAGESITLRYRVIFHRGNESEARLAEAFARYRELP